MRRFLRWWHTRALRAQIAYYDSIADDYALSGSLRSYYRIRSYELRKELRMTP